MAHSRAKREVMMESGKNCIKGAINPKNKGTLHRSLDVPEGREIPEKKLEKAEHSKDPATKKRVILAETLRNFKQK
jgi:hypothetical protein